MTLQVSSIQFFPPIAENIIEAELGMEVNLPCGVPTPLGYPFWFLNEDLFSLFYLLQIAPSISFEGSANNDLAIVPISLRFNNTFFQCGTYIGSTLSLGIPNRLIISM